MRSVKFLVTMMSSVLLVACNDGTENTNEETNEETTNSETVDEVTNDRNIESNEEQSDTSQSDENTEDESSETVHESFDKVEAAAKDIDSYAADVVVEAAVDDIEQDILNLHVEHINNDPPSIKVQVDGEDRTISTEGDTYFYNGNEWINVSESINVDQLYKVTYINVVNTIVNIKDDVDVTEGEETYTYTYNGDDADIFELFEQLFAVSFGAVDTSQVHNDLSVTIDKDTHLIHTLSYAAKGEDEEGQFSMDGEIAFNSFNEVGPIEAPLALETEDISE